MQIGSISSMAINPSTPTTTQSSSKSAAVPVSSGAASQTTPAASSRTPESGKTASSSSQAQSSASSVQEETLAAVYSTTVAGKNYSGSVDESGGVYEASVANLPGASASGSSIQSAENNLNIRIDTLA